MVSTSGIAFGDGDGPVLFAGLKSCRSTRTSLPNSKPAHVLLLRQTEPFGLECVRFITGVPGIKAGALGLPGLISGQRSRPHASIFISRPVTWRGRDDSAGLVRNGSGEYVRNSPAKTERERTATHTPQHRSTHTPFLSGSGNPFRGCRIHSAPFRNRSSTSLGKDLP